METWRETLSKTGFVVDEGTYADDKNTYTVFACTKPR